MMERDPLPVHLKKRQCFMGNEMKCKSGTVFVSRLKFSLVSLSVRSRSHTVCFVD
jgi:hypothetical protein